MIDDIDGGIYWVGTYSPASGFSINSYLIIDEYPTLINASAPAYVDLMIDKIRSIMRIEDLQYIVLNQADIAYAGGLKALTSLIPQARIITSKYESFRLGLYGLFIQPLIIQDGDKLKIGNTTLNFFSAPFVGSPDAIFIYEETNGILFSGEAFSTTVSEWKTVTEKDMTELLEAYYETHVGDSIIAKNSISMLKELDIKLIAPGHGPALYGNIGKYVDALSSVLR